MIVLIEDADGAAPDPGQGQGAITAGTQRTVRRKLPPSRGAPGHDPPSPCSTATNTAPTSHKSTPPVIHLHWCRIFDR